MICAALDWDRTRKDYVECDLRNPVQLVRLCGIVTLQVSLCDAHRALFEREFAVFGGKFDKVKRVKVVRSVNAS
jgi:hypothetical protein